MFFDPSSSIRIPFALLLVLAGLPHYLCVGNCLYIMIQLGYDVPLHHQLVGCLPMGWVRCCSVCRECVINTGLIVFPFQFSNFTYLRVTSRSGAVSDE